ncbi:MAG TPA: hypothetical protein VGN60_07530 [Devosia sp.]|nr:hypothetical protein [Devosia sp.]
MNRAVLVSALSLILMSSAAAQSGADALRAFGLDSSAAIEQNLDRLNDVRKTVVPNFDAVWTGVQPVFPASVMIGAQDNTIRMMSIGTKGYVGADDRHDIRALEAGYGLEGLDRHEGECDSAMEADGLECLVVYYACPVASPECHLMLLSIGTPGNEERGLTKVTWTSEPTNKLRGE